MEKQSIVHHTFHLERSFPVPVKRAFDAFADPSKKRRWYAESETHEIESFEHDFRVGGSERLQYRFKEGTQFPGLTILNEGLYFDIIPHERIVCASAMTFQGKRVSVSLVSFEFAPSSGGTELRFVHQGAFFEGSGGPQIREAGWVALLDKLRNALTT